MEIEATQAIPLSDYEDEEETDEENEGVAQPVAFLKVLLRRGYPEKEFPIYDGINMIGRDPGCNIHIDLRALSKQHASIEVKSGQHFLVDKGSKNKTRRNKMYLVKDVRYEVRTGDKLTFADVDCIYTVKETLNSSANTTKDLVIPESGSETGSEALLSQPDRRQNDVSAASASTSNGAAGITNLTAATLCYATDSDDSDDEILQQPFTSRKALVEDTPAATRVKRASGATYVPDSQALDDTGVSEGATVLCQDSDRDGKEEEEEEKLRRMAFESTQAYGMVGESDDDDDTPSSPILDAATQFFDPPATKSRKSKPTGTVAYDMDVESTQTAAEIHSGNLEKSKRQEVAIGEAETQAYDMDFTAKPNKGAANKNNANLNVSDASTNSGGDLETPTQTFSEDHNKDTKPESKNIAKLPEKKIDLGIGQTMAYEFDDSDASDDDLLIPLKKPLKFKDDVNEEEEPTQAFAADETVAVADNDMATQVVGEEVGANTSNKAASDAEEATQAVSDTVQVEAGKTDDEEAETQCMETMPVGKGKSSGARCLSLKSFVLNDSRTTLVEPNATDDAETQAFGEGEGETQVIGGAEETQVFDKAPLADEAQTQVLDQNLTGVRSAARGRGRGRGRSSIAEDQTQILNAAEDEDEDGTQEFEVTTVGSLGGSAKTGGNKRSKHLTNETQEIMVFKSPFVPGGRKSGFGAGDATQMYDDVATQVFTEKTESPTLLVATTVTEPSKPADRRSKVFSPDRGDEFNPGGCSTQVDKEAFEDQPTQIFASACDMSTQNLDLDSTTDTDDDGFAKPLLPLPKFRKLPNKNAEIAKTASPLREAFNTDNLCTPSYDADSSEDTEEQNHKQVNPPKPDDPVDTTDSIPVDQMAPTLPAMTDNTETQAYGLVEEEAEEEILSPVFTSKNKSRTPVSAEMAPTLPAMTDNTETQAYVEEEDEILSPVFTSKNKSRTPVSAEKAPTLPAVTDNTETQAYGDEEEAEILSPVFTSKNNRRTPVNAEKAPTLPAMTDNTETQAYGKEEEEKEEVVSPVFTSKNKSRTKRTPVSVEVSDAMETQAYDIDENIDDDDIDDDDDKAEKQQEEIPKKASPVGTINKSIKLKLNTDDMQTQAYMMDEDDDDDEDETLPNLEMELSTVDTPKTKKLDETKNKTKLETVESSQPNEDDHPVSPLPLPTSARNKRKTAAKRKHTSLPDEAPAESKKSKTEESNLSPEIEASGNRRPTKRGRGKTKAEEAIVETDFTNDKDEKVEADVETSQASVKKPRGRPSATVSKPTENVQEDIEESDEKVVAVIPSALKRGRGRKSAAHTSGDAVADAVEKASEGKNAQEEDSAVVPKKGRGRDKSTTVTDPEVKSAKVSENEEDASTAKKGRGKARGKLTDVTPDVEDQKVADETVIPRKGRGRAKSSVPPAKEEVAEVAEADDAKEDTSSPKRGKKKAASTSAVDSSDKTTESEEVESSSVRRGRGRISKTLNNTSPSKSEIALDTEGTNPEVSNDNESVGVVKKVRGRSKATAPEKVVETEKTPTKDVPKSEEKQTGRSRRTRTNSTSSPTSEKAEVSNDKESEGVVKKGRGRSKTNTSVPEKVEATDKQIKELSSSQEQQTGRPRRSRTNSMSSHTSDKAEKSSKGKVCVKGKACVKGKGSAKRSTSPETSEQDVDDKATETVGKAGRRGRPSAATSPVKETVTSSQSSTRSSRARRSSETSVTSEKDSGEGAATKGRGRGKTKPSEATQPQRDSSDSSSRNRRTRKSSVTSHTSEQQEVTDNSSLKKKVGRKGRTTVSPPDEKPQEEEAEDAKPLSGRGRRKKGGERTSVSPPPEKLQEEDEEDAKPGQGRGRGKGRRSVSPPPDEKSQEEEADAKPPSGRGRGKKGGEKTSVSPPPEKSPKEDEEDAKPGRGRGRGKGRTSMASSPEKSQEVETEPASGRGRGKSRTSVSPPPDEKSQEEEVDAKPGRGRGRGKGRPSAAVMDVDLPVVGKSKGRGRGRGRKSSRSSSPASGAAAEREENEKESKADDEDKVVAPKRGRKSGKADDKPQNTAAAVKEEIPASPVKTGRGRKRQSVQIVESQESSATLSLPDSETVSQDQDSESVSSTPRKNTRGGVKEKNKPTASVGKRASRKDKEETQSSQDSAASTEIGSFQVKTEPGLPTTTRKRGKERMGPASGSTSQEPAEPVVKRIKSEPPSTPPPRKAGRGRGKVVEVESVGAANCESPKGRGRGKAAQLPTTPNKGKGRGKAASLSSSQASTPETPSALRRRTLDRSPKIMFTGVVDKEGERIVESLGGSTVKDVFLCTHLVSDQVRRTVKFLCGVARGLLIVKPEWLEQCRDSRMFIDASPFLVKDTQNEKAYSFSLARSLNTYQQHGAMLTGYTVYVTKGVKPEPAQMKEIIICAGGLFASTMPKKADDSHKTVVISCPADLVSCKGLVKLGIPVVSSEFILTGILQQKVDTKKYCLIPGTSTESTESAESTATSTKRKKR